LAVSPEYPDQFLSNSEFKLCSFPVSRPVPL
jgi:hypothetical protein